MNLYWSQELLCLNWMSPNLKNHRDLRGQIQSIDPNLKNRCQHLTNFQAELNHHGRILMIDPNLKNRCQHLTNFQA